MLELIIPYSALLLALATAAGTVIVSFRNKKTREESQAAAMVAKREADKLQAEEERITVASAERVVNLLRSELDRKDLRLDRQAEKMDRQVREISALRRWIAQAKIRFAELGINGLPPVPQAVDED